MTHGPEHHIEHAEHAAHAAHDGFNKNVTMSIAIVAAVLACVTMLGHRAHNETLRLQGEALSLQTEAGINNTKSTNKWGYYQSKNMVSLESEIAADFLSVMSVRDDMKEEYEEMLRGYQGNVAYYKGNKDYRTRKSKKNHSAKEEKKSEEKKREEKKEGKLAEIETEARKIDEETDSLLEQAKKKVEESHREHLKAARLDYGELGLQLAVVLCSLAILTRNRSFWYTGLLSAGIGAVIAVTGQFGLFMGTGHH